MPERDRCTCKSYNRPEPYQITPPVVAVDPYSPSGRTVCLDYCIAEAIQHLWAQGIATGGSCCGHNRHRPSVVLACQEPRPNPAYAQIVLDHLREADARDWSVMVWTLLSYRQTDKAGPPAMEIPLWGEGGCG